MMASFLRGDVTPEEAWVWRSWENSSHPALLLAAVPGSVGDGGEFIVGNSLTVTAGTTTGETRTFVGGLLGESRLRRFLVAPKGSEVTGLTETADGKALLVNIQHPGESPSERSNPDKPKAFSDWPDRKLFSRPRSATIVIWREDGKPVGA